jgi:hypothetical protein
LSCCAPANAGAETVNTKPKQANAISFFMGFSLVVDY